MSNIDTLIANAVKDAEITDYIMLVRNKCIRLIKVEDFITDITLGGDAVCDTLLNCWKSMGQFDGGTNPDNGDDEDCDCSEDFVKIHFPKGEGIKIVSSDEYTKMADSIYVQTIDSDKYKLVVVDEEGNVREMALPDSPIIDYPVVNGEALNYTTEEQGFNVFKQLQNKKLQFLPLVGENLAITYLYSGSEVVGIKIGNPSSFQFRTFYVNENYPFNDGNGTIGKPYKTFNECYNDYVSPTEDNPNRPGQKYNRAYPKNKGAKIIIQSAITTDVNPSINQMIFENTEGFSFTYTGNTEYMFDTEQIYPLIDKVGTTLQDEIYFRIIGKGNFRRTNDTNRGLVRCWGSNRTNDPNHNSSVSSIDIGDSLSDLKFTEADPVFTGKTFIDMQAYVNGSLVNLQSVYGSEYKATTDNLYLPSINKSLFNIQYRNTGSGSTFTMDGKTTIQSFSQTSFYSKNCLLNLNGQIYHTGFNNYVAYNGTTNYDTISPTGLSWLRYIPHTGKFQFQFDDDSLIYCKGFYMDERAGFGHYGWDAAIYASKTAVFQEFICRHFSQNYYNSFVKLTSTNDTFALGTGGAGIISEIQAPNAQYLISGGLSGTGENISCLVANTTIYAYKDLKPTSSLSKVIFNTRGTLLSLKGRPVISGIESFPDSSIAESQGIVTGGLFKDASKLII